MNHTPSILESEKKWYLVSLPLRSCSLRDIATSNTSKEQMDEYYQEAQTILEQESGSGQMDRGRWYNAQFLSRGTTSDKIAAAAVKLADTDFMFFLEGFNLLFETARTDTHHYEAALKALTVVWPKLLPPRPLKRFVSQYFATLPVDSTERKKVLVYWYLEDYLKRTYAQFLSLSEAMLKDHVVQRREAWLDVVGRLLCSVAEGRSTTMAMMIDKMGDPVSRVAHKAYHHILKLLSESSTHQAMLFTELEKIIFMKNCPLRTMRYATNVMNQLVFSKDERKLAVKSLQTYLSLFRQLVVTGNVDSTVTTAIIVGMRRAFPYAGLDLRPLEEHLNALFILANTGNFQQRVSTLTLLQLVALHKGTSDAFRTRWYRTLYRLLLLSPKQVPQSAQMTNFFSMLHKALSADTSKDRIVAFVHRLLQRAVFFNDAMICAVLLLVGELMQMHPYVRELVRPHKSAHSTASSYDPKARDPQFAKASTECVWTLNLLARHSHPSVVKLSVLLLFGEEIVFDVHPLDDMTPLNFLNMFVDAKLKARDEDKPNAATSVFSRSAHKATLPSTSDPYFIHAAPQDVDVSALFLHRYAVQRQRFMDGLAQVRSSWGDTTGEFEAAKRVANIDDALFGPSGVLAEEEVEKAEEPTTVEAKVAARLKAKKAKKDLEEQEAARAALRGEEDANVPSDADDESSAEGDGEDDFFDAEGGDSDLEWGEDDEAAYAAALENGDDDDDDDGSLIGGDSDMDMDDDDDDDMDNALGGHAAGMEVDGDDFGDVLESHTREMSKKRKRENDWLDRRSGDADHRDSFRGGRGGRGGASFSRGGGNGRGGRGRGGRGAKRGRY